MIPFIESPLPPPVSHVLSIPHSTMFDVHHWFTFFLLFFPRLKSFCSLNRERKRERERVLSDRIVRCYSLSLSSFSFLFYPSLFSVKTHFLTRQISTRQRMCRENLGFMKHFFTDNSSNLTWHQIDLPIYNLLLLSIENSQNQRYASLDFLSPPLGEEF